MLKIECYRALPLQLSLLSAVNVKEISHFLKDKMPFNQDLPIPNKVSLQSENHSDRVWKYSFTNNNIQEAKKYSHRGESIFCTS